MRIKKKMCLMDRGHGKYKAISGHTEKRQKNKHSCTPRHRHEMHHHKSAAYVLLRITENEYL